MGNNPITMVDPDGGFAGPGDGCDGCIQLDEIVISATGGGGLKPSGVDLSFGGWNGLTKADLMSALETLNERAAELKYQSLVQSWGQANFPSFVVPSSPVVPNEIDPDGISTGQTIIMPNMELVPNTIFWEVKATKSSKLRNKKQFQRYIDYLDNLDP